MRPLSAEDRVTSIQARVASARQQLREAGIAPVESDLDARLLAQQVLDWTTERYLSDAGGSEPATFAQAYSALVARRATREPLAYIVGHREFWGLKFEVNPDVLIPRPATELIVEATLELFPNSNAALRIADVCTGCGCVAVAVAHERPRATVVASDISPAALDVARRNADRHGVGRRVSFRIGDLLRGLDSVEYPFDAILANPPYVVDRARPALQPEVRDFEPALALFGGSDGLEVITRLVAEAPRKLRLGGYLVFEFGLGQDVEIEELVQRAPDLTLVGVRRDLQGISRTVIAQRV
jgi:release factor glutamine methyltransferase